MTNDQNLTWAARSTPAHGVLSLFRSGCVFTIQQLGPVIPTHAITTSLTWTPGAIPIAEVLFLGKDRQGRWWPVAVVLWPWRSALLRWLLMPTAVGKERFRPSWALGTAKVCQPADRQRAQPAH